MARESKPPPLVGSQRIKYLATCFNSTDGTVEGVKNKFDRARLQARIRFEERMAANWVREVNFEHGSPDGSYEKLPAENREAALLEDHHETARLEAAYRKDLRRPALLRGTMWDYLQPFPKDNDHG